MIKMVKGGIPGCHANVEDVYRMYAKDIRFQPKGKDEEVEGRGSRVEGRTVHPGVCPEGNRCLRSAPRRRIVLFVECIVFL